MVDLHNAMALKWLFYTNVVIIFNNGLQIAGLQWLCLLWMILNCYINNVLCL